MTNGSERPCGSCHVVEGPHRSDCYWYNPSYESGRKVHDLKVNPQFWDGLVAGLKPFELRRNDRAFKKGDGLLLRRYDHSTGYTGQSIERQISYILYPEDCPGLALGFVILGLQVEPLAAFKELLDRRIAAKKAVDRVEAYALKLELNAMAMRLQRDGFDVGFEDDEKLNPPC